MLTNKAIAVDCLSYSGNHLLDHDLNTVELNLKIKSFPAFVRK
jgi:hypothetical protein